LKEWDLRTLKCLREIKCHNGAVNGIEITDIKIVNKCPFIRVIRMSPHSGYPYVPSFGLSVCPLIRVIRMSPHSGYPYVTSFGLSVCHLIRVIRMSPHSGYAYVTSFGLCVCHLIRVIRMSPHSGFPYVPSFGFSVCPLIRVIRMSPHSGYPYVPSFGLYLITNYMNTTLGNVVKNHCLNTENIKKINYQLLRGLKYLHSYNIIHFSFKFF
jgi:hypothetical protein